MVWKEDDWLIDWVCVFERKGNFRGYLVLIWLGNKGFVILLEECEEYGICLGEWYEKVNVEEIDWKVIGFLGIVVFLMLGVGVVVKGRVGILRVKLLVVFIL